MKEDASRCRRGRGGYKYPPAATGFYYLSARRRTMYLPISPQWKGLMPPVVQLYTRADLGLQSGGAESHNNVKKKKKGGGGGRYTFPGKEEVVRISTVTQEVL